MYVIGVDPAAPDSEMCGCICPQCRRPFTWKPQTEKTPTKCPMCGKQLNFAGLKAIK